MCGICGWVRPAGIELSDLVRMNQVASHRGPDGEGYWLWDGASATGQFFATPRATEAPQCSRVALGSRRLAILDLSSAGLQPMPSKTGRVWIAFNGEIYNYVELRNELLQLGHQFRTGTDTEVILAAYDQWGADCFARFNGMWGLAIVDLQRRTLILSRDRLGIKPLYVWAKNHGLAFASEIKQLLTLPGLTAVANMDALVGYIDTGYEVPPATFFADIYAFPPGCWAEVSLDKPHAPSPHSFWNPEQLTLRQIDRVEAREQTRCLFEDAVRLCLRSDVPVGVCLSGGLDSSSVLGQVQRLKDGKGASTYAFSAAFHETSFDERQYISLMLRECGGEGYYTFPSAEAFLEDFDNFIFHHDEPPGSLSQYAAWSVMRLARQHHVPVLLNGQGGDELFSGYWPAYYLFLRRQLAQAPYRVAEHVLGALLPHGNPALVLQAFAHFRQYRHRRQRDNRTLLQPRWASAGFNLTANWAVVAQHLEPVQYRLAEIRHMHLPRLLKWDDRNSMAFSIEGRYPFLDHRFVEWAMTLPPEMNLKRGWNKLLLREALSNILPPAIQWRRSKVGFETPQSEWIRTTLRSVLAQWAAHPSERLQEIIDPSRLKRFAEQLLGSNTLHKMDERQLGLVRLYFLDRWLTLFKVDL
jgi:asparagine synthase (glutamine-hydrolysing)